MHELIPPDSALDPQVTNLSGVRCKRPNVLRLMVTLHNPYICRLGRRTHYVYSSAVDGSVLIVVARECIVASGSVPALRPLLGVGAPSVLCCCLSFLLAPHQRRTVQ